MKTNIHKHKNATKVAVHKYILISFAIAITTLVACNSATDTKQNNGPNDTATAAHQQKTTDTRAFSVKEIIASYLQIKNALAKDNAKDAATAAGAIAAILDRVNKTSLSANQLKTYNELQDDIKENAEHIGANADKIEHQREHFVMLSKDIADLLKTFGNGGQTLYKDFCPMANDGKGAIWISEVKEIQNPYLGSKMPTCGSVKETIK